MAAEAPPLAFGTREIDQVGEAFNAARRTAIQGAVEEATLRRNVSDVFVNLARRSQTLLHRQLKLLDSMERRIETPDDLEDLFRVDHLATRMRRHAEGLIILSGQAPGRGWRSPVAIVDVARAAASEVEDYTRVNVAPMTRAAIVGPAVADVIHLLAELIENAATFSPPHTTVQVQGQAVAHGFTLEVEDRGLSMDETRLAAANQRLATSAEFDLSDSAQLGLFVVGRLARRHGIKVTLRTSPYGGMTAIVLLPEDLVVPDEGDPVQGAPALTTRRAEDALVPVGTVVGAHHGAGRRPAAGAGAGLRPGRLRPGRLRPGRVRAAASVGAARRGGALAGGGPPRPLAAARQPVRPAVRRVRPGPEGSLRRPSTGGPGRADRADPGVRGAAQGPVPTPRGAPSPWGDPPSVPEAQPAQPAAAPAAPGVPRSPREVRRRPPGGSGRGRPRCPSASGRRTWPPSCARTAPPRLRPPPSRGPTGRPSSCGR
ncbi:ATP-binding protein [Actinomadura madurae]|uniref:sensor histidine kinase n=1 Tax=Actinomadura madurae TaxID=1993 RepID=UPI0020D215B6|nr:ATP-binding protein [Actinomadura madurae]MCP9953788.1 ATP-binding protein [Actinomadura madurae]